MMTDLNRRRFIETATLGAGALAVAPAMAQDKKKKGKGKGKAAEKRSAIDRVALGTTGIVASRLAMGTGFRGSKRSSELTRMGQEQFTKVVREGFDSGLNFMDMADLYGSHPFVKKTLAGVPRDQYIALSKIWPKAAKWNDASGGAIEEVERFNKELGVDYLDICLIHCCQNSEWPEEFKRIRDELSELKAQKKIRATGCSCHDLGALKVAAEHPWVDVLFARINNTGASMDGTPEEIAPVLRKARKNGKVVVGMKIIGAGKLSAPEQIDASMKYVVENELVDAITIGMLEQKQIAENIARFDKALAG